MLETFHLHKIPAEMIRSGEVARWNTPRILTDDVRRLATSVQYRDPSGAVTWVDLADDVSREIAAQLDEAPYETPSRSAFTVKVKPLSWTGPGPFDPIEDWEQWLAEVQAMPDFPMKDYCIDTAKQTIERMRQYLRAARHGEHSLQ